MISQLNQLKLCDDTHSECLTSVGAGKTNPVTLISILFVLGIAYAVKSGYNFSNKNGTSGGD